MGVSETGHPSHPDYQIQLWDPRRYGPWSRDEGPGEYAVQHPFSFPDEEAESRREGVLPVYPGESGTELLPS